MTLIRELLAAVTRSIVSLVGFVLTTVAGVLFCALFVIQELRHFASPYPGILSFIILPGIFVLGLLLMPLGMWLIRRSDRRNAAEGAAARRSPIIDLNVPRTRNIALIVLVLTFTNLIILATGTYKAVEVMETTEFCGGACHSVMSPEFTTYQRSAHSRVRCTQCHIGPGAGWFVKSKLSGSWQLVSVALNLYPRPIPTPVANLRPARETCEQCHWPTKFVGERLKVITHFSDDEKAVEKKTVLLLRVGGVQLGEGRGIHWHVDPKNTVRYRADTKRQHMMDVELTRADGTKKVFKSSETMPAGAVPGEWRTMDCVDCHNRPTHVYQRPVDEVDGALTAGRLDRTLPYIRREALRIVQLPFSSHEDAKVGIKNALTEFYTKGYPELAKSEPTKIAAAADALYAIYSTNVFPQMNITWGTYPNFRFDEGGCFRCHNSELSTAEGKHISKKCDLCHAVLAEGEENPEILETLGQ